jgi:hypothetical protein
LREPSAIDWIGSISGLMRRRSPLRLKKLHGREGETMTIEDTNPSATDDRPAAVESKEPKRKRGPDPRAGAKSFKSADDTDRPRAEEPEQHDPHDAGYRQHPLGALFPPVSDQERRAWAAHIRKHGQRHDIVQHPDGSILDGWNTLHSCLIAAVKPRITTWDGKPGDELAFVISQNVLRRHLNESQRAMIASKLATLPSGQRQDGKFAGVPTQAQAAKILHVSPRMVRTARKVQEEAPANVTRLVDAGRITLHAVESTLPQLSQVKQRIEGLSDDEVEVEVTRLTKDSALSRRTMGQADTQTNEAHPPAALETSANPARDDDENGNRAIGAKAVLRALNRIEIKADTPERQAFVSAIERLPLSDAAWACEVASYVEQEARNIEKAVRRRGDSDVSAPPVTTAPPADNLPN